MPLAARASLRFQLRPALEVLPSTPPAFSLSFPGCGVMLHWQLGVLKGLSRHIDTSTVPMLGSSSGALVTAIAGCGVPPEHAAEEMLRLMDTNRVTQRRMGLLGSLGDITRQWLENCLPADAGALLSRGRTTVLVTQLPLLRTAHITSFDSKQDVVEVVMASAHLPLVLDGTWYTLCRRRPSIDGGFWWWWHRCDLAYRVAGGATPPSASSPAAAAAAEGRAADVASRAPLSSTSFAAAAAAMPWYGGYGDAAAAAGGSGGTRGSLLRSQSPPGVALSSPTALLDFLAGDVQRVMAAEVGRAPPPARRGASPPRPIVGPPGSAPGTASGRQHQHHQHHQHHAGGGGGGGGSAAAVTPARGLASSSSSCPSPPPASSSSSPAVLLVQPSDDPALAADWQRFRNWRPDDLEAAREMLRRGEAYGAGPLRARLEQCL